MQEGIHVVSKCPTSIGFSECPHSFPFAFQQGKSCCKLKIDYDRRTMTQPYINFDSKSCKDFAGMDQSTACTAPPCLNHNCWNYSCFIGNKDISGGKLKIKVPYKIIF